MGFGDFMEGVGDAVSNVAKGTAWVANPTHWDDIAEGAGNAIEFVGEHPGQALAMAGEVGKAVIQDQLDPVNLAINAGLIAATVATGGAAAPAFLAKLGLSAKGVATGVAAAEGAEAVGTTLKAVKAADTALDVTQGVKTAAQVTETVGDIGKGVETAAGAVEAATGVAETGQALSRTQQFAQGVRKIGTDISESSGLMERAENVLNAPREFIGTAREAAGMSRYGRLAQSRANQANKILGSAEDVGGFRQALARKVGGSNNPLVGSRAHSTLSRATSLVSRGRHIAEAPSEIEKGVEVAAHPEAVVQDAVAAETERRLGEIGEGTGYVDRGMAAESLYQPGGAMPAQPPALPPPSLPPILPAQPASQVIDKSSRQVNNYNSFNFNVSPTQRRVRGEDSEGNARGWRASQRFWQGPTREAIGGISVGHDWRTMQMRKIESPGVRSRSSDSDDWNLNEQGAPARLAPQASESGALMSDQGGQSEAPSRQEPRMTNFHGMDMTEERADELSQNEWAQRQPGGMLDQLKQPSVYTNPATAPTYRGTSRTSSRNTLGV